MLEQKGLIEMRLGISGGAIVKESNSDQFSESLALLIKHQKVPVSQLGEFREFMDGQVAALAAERATPEDIARLKELLAEAKRHLDKGVDYLDDFDRADNELHIAFAHVSRNMIFISIIVIIASH